jgi:hypothetical protein
VGPPQYYFATENGIMAKDPAFLFYYVDFAWGTRKMDRRHKGAYVDLLILQADKFAAKGEYRITLDEIQAELGKDFDCWEDLQSKYVCVRQGDTQMFFNLKLYEVQKERLNFCKSRRNNRLQSKQVKITSQTLVPHMEDELRSDEDKGSNPEGDSKGEDWRDSFPAYQKELERQLSELMQDREWFADRERYHSGLDIKLSIEKTLNDFWGTEVGWKWKIDSKVETFNLKQTLTNALSDKRNQVWKQKPKV